MHKKNLFLVTITGILLFTSSFLITQNVLARSLGYTWYVASTPIRYDTILNPTWKTIIQKGMNTWNDVSTKKQFQFNSSSTNATGDISASNRPADTWIGKMFPTTGSFSGKTYMTRADIIFNTKYEFADGAVAGAYDIQSVATHELGHALGIAHCHDADSQHSSGDQDYTMYNYSFTNETKARSLTQYDKDAKNSLY
ncbi:matrixin family metalloprotease [Paenibacillus sp. FSL H8-0283]|uniref:matrixin family metalloprotease n=1 Tax=Paenibacillus sp. FSL H8-0283 TaxID=2921383 RepID=UPI0032484CA8